MYVLRWHTLHIAWEGVAHSISLVECFAINLYVYSLYIWTKYILLVVRCMRCVSGFVCVCECQPMRVYKCYIVWDMWNTHILSVWCMMLRIPWSFLYNSPCMCERDRERMVETYPYFVAVMFIRLRYAFYKYFMFHHISLHNMNRSFRFRFFFSSFFRFCMIWMMMISMSTYNSISVNAYTWSKSPQRENTKNTIETKCRK